MERLLEGFAFLAARVHLKIDDDFPEVSEALLNVVYPHYVRPVPSMSLVGFELDPEQGKKTTGTHVPKGSVLYSRPVGGARPGRVERRSSQRPGVRHRRLPRHAGVPAVLGARKPPRGLRPSAEDAPDRGRGRVLAEPRPRGRGPARAVRVPGRPDRVRVPRADVRPPCGLGRRRRAVAPTLT